MLFFPFIEGIFYLSLGIIVVLIFLIVFHFKQRIENLEKKGFLLTEVYNNLLKELNIMKSVVYSPPQVHQKQNIVFSTFSNEPETETYKKIVVMDKIDEDEDQEDEEDTDIDTDIEDDEENDNVEPEPKEDLSMEEVTDLEVKTVDPEFESNEKLSSSINVTKLDQETETETETETESNIPPSTNTNTVSYSKLNLQELKMLVISKGLSSNPSKMKRMDLLKLLEEETI
jgi:hypothetical protein